MTFWDALLADLPKVAILAAAVWAIDWWAIPVFERWRKRGVGPGQALPKKEGQIG